MMTRCVRQLVLTLASYRLHDVKSERRTNDRSDKQDLRERRKVLGPAQRRAEEQEQNRQVNDSVQLPQRYGEISSMEHTPHPHAHGASERPISEGAEGFRRREGPR